ncbi:MAG: LysR family transcriptional regulator [Muribaculaceae bacterium]|nr:LysR family transcriptional regulator [Muribaculaceae bacterium]
MYVKELTTLITVADQGSFLKAAKELYITPASVMNQINKLEVIIGVKLVERTNQGAILTAAGRSVYQDAKQIIEFSNAAIEKARQLAVSEQNVIRVGTSILRPCKRLIDLWEEIDDGTFPFQIRIVPFDDDPAGLGSAVSSLGNQIDCFVGPCDSNEWRKQHSILLLEQIPCRIAVPRKHRLAKKKSLNWSDLDGETFMIIRSSDTPVLSQMRDDISENHPQIKIADVSNFYDTSIFNECERMNYLMETLDIWADVHPSLVTLPMGWEYKMPYGIVYAKSPSKVVRDFIAVVRKSIKI